MRKYAAKVRKILQLHSHQPEKVVNTDFSEQADTETENLRFLGFARKPVGTDPDTALRPMCNYEVSEATVYVNKFDISLTDGAKAAGTPFAVITPSRDSVAVCG